MKILVISDSHNHKITKLDLDSFDYIFHCGDIMDHDLDFLNLYPNSYYVKGNCDYNNYPLSKEIDLANYKIFMTHSNIYNTKYTYDNLVNNTIDKYDLVFFGHTHKQIVFRQGKTTYLNPGAYKNNEYAYILDNTIYLVKDEKVVNTYNLL